MGKIAELFVELGVKAKTSVLELFKTKLGELRVGTIAEIVSLEKLSQVLFDLGKQSLETAVHYKYLSEAFGINSQWLQKMEYAGQKFNVSVQQTDESIQGLQQNLAAFMIGQGSMGFLRAAGWFGVNFRPGMTAKDLLPQLAEKVPEFIKRHGALGAAEASLLLSQMGVDPAMIQELIHGPKALHVGDKAKIITDKNIAAMAALSANISITNQEVHYLAYDAIGKLIAVLQPFTESVANTIMGAAGFESKAGIVLGHPWESFKHAFFGNPDEAARYFAKMGIMSPQTQSVHIEQHNDNRTTLHVRGDDAVKGGKSAVAEIKSAHKKHLTLAMFQLSKLGPVY